MFKFLTGECSIARTAAEEIIDDRIDKIAEEIFELDEPEILLDMRKLNGKPNSTTFDAFWNEVALYVEELTPAVDDRRHGSVLHMPISISIGDLRDTIAHRLLSKHEEEDAQPEVPSTEWIRLQFAPRNPYATSSLRHTGRLDIKFAVQQRQLCKEHVDSKYVMMLLKYAKEFAVRFRDVVTMVCVDDKAIIPVGEPGAPVSTGVRGHHRSLVPTSAYIGALDHDFHIHGIVSSVSLIVDIPQSPLDSFFSGQVYVGNKNKVTQVSSPLCHAAELSKVILSEQCSENAATKSVLLVVSDGGPDHRLSYGTVQTSLLALFIRQNLDMLIAIRTCPYQSWTNPAERVMSILNLALQNVSLERKAMDEESEKKLKNKNNLKAVRSEIDANPGLATKVNDSVQPVIDLLNGRFCRMKLKEKVYKAAKVASSVDMETMFSEVSIIDSSLSYDDLSQKTLKKAKSLQGFLDAHCHSTHYAYQLRKCVLDSCSYCSTHPIRMPLEQFSSLSYLPMPRMDATGQHFKKFVEVYGQLPNESDRPSLGQSKCDEAEEIDKANRKLLSSSGKVQMAIHCGECFKPRCVYSEARLTQEERGKICDLEEDYSCGSVLFPPTSMYHNTIVTRANLTCRDPVEPQYYSTRLVNFPPVCSHCGSPEETLIENELV